MCLKFFQLIFKKFEFFFRVQKFVLIYFGKYVNLQTDFFEKFVKTLIFRFETFVKMIIEKILKNFHDKMIFF